LTSLEIYESIISVINNGFGGICRKGKYRKKKQENVEEKNVKRENSEIKNIE
jgi:hypothetical protein